MVPTFFGPAVHGVVVFFASMHIPMEDTQSIYNLENCFPSSSSNNHIFMYTVMLWKSCLPIIVGYVFVSGKCLNLKITCVRWIFYSF
jgi:hypothetical protein